MNKRMRRNCLRCLIPLCRDELKPMTRIRLCPTCRMWAVSLVGAQLVIEGMKFLFRHV